MNIYLLLIIMCWVAFICVWLFSSFFAKASSRRSTNFGLFSMLFRAGVVLIVLLIVRLGIRVDLIPAVRYSTADPILQALGAVICALGITFAIWARSSLGRNWGMPGSLRAEPTLITSGPYRYVRHPIYTGVLLGMLGSALVAGSWWLAVFIASLVYFMYNAYREERDMLALFPDTYPAYRARTKMLVPFIF